MTEDIKSSHAHVPRLLLFTKDQGFLDENSDTYKHINGLGGVFQEVHVVLIDHHKKNEPSPIVRLSKNIWLYRTQSSAWWRQVYDAYKLAEEQMVFSGGFRADIIVSEDTYESGIAGWFLSKKFDVPFQIHITDNFYDGEFLETTNHPVLYDWSTDYLLRRVQSVRTQTELQKTAVIETNKKLKDYTEVLPVYYNLDTWRDGEPSFDLKKKYPQYKFIMLHISAMQRSSHSVDVLRSAAQILSAYPAIGLVIVGNGPLRSKLEKLAIELGIQNQVQFEPSTNDIVSYLKTAHILIHLSENSEEDKIVLAAASTKIPIVASSTGLAGELFVDDESAQLCESTDADCIAEGINRYLNENRERSEFALRAFENVFEKIEQDYNAYIESYRDSVTKCINTEEKEKVE